MEFDENISFRYTYKFQHVPIKDIIIGETLTVEKIPEDLA